MFASLVTLSEYKQAAQQIFSCSKSTIEILRKSVKHVQSNNKNNRTTSLTGVFVVKFEYISNLFLLLLVLTLNKYMLAGWAVVVKLCIY